MKFEPRSNNAIAAGNSSFKASGKKQTHHQKLDLARHPGKAKGTHKQMRAQDRPLENDFVTPEDVILHIIRGTLQGFFGLSDSFFFRGDFSIQVLSF